MAQDLTIASYRLPVSLDRATGELLPSMGGLATALASVKPPASHWVGALDGDGAGLHEGQTNYHPLGMSDEEKAGHYAGFSNGVMWPVYHGLPEFVPGPEDTGFWTSAADEWYKQYREVNQRYAAELVRHASPNSLEWVHDYQLQLVPAMLRTQRPDLTIGFFLHIPFPSYEHYARIPHHEELLTGLLTNDVLGFQTTREVDNFTTILTQVLGRGTPLLVNNQAVRLQDGAIYIGDRQLRVDAYPISIDFAKYDALGRNDEVRAEAQRIRDTLGNRKIVAGIERLDYTKGISERLDALELLLKEGQFNPREHVMYLSFANFRKGVEATQQYAKQLAERIAKINKASTVVDPETGERWQPIHDHWEDTPPELVPAVYLAADVMTITPLRDGMNLMAKEFVAARSDEGGALVLGKGAGAALELELDGNGALIVDPRTSHELANAIKRGLAMPREEQGNRMRRMRSWVQDHQVDAWSASFVHDLRQAQAQRATQSSTGGLRVSSRPPTAPLRTTGRPLDP